MNYRLPVNSSLTSLIRLLAVGGVVSLLLVGVALPAHAQSTTYDQSYGSGAYGRQDFGGTTIIDDSEHTPKPSPSISTSASPAGDLPDSGAHLGLWAAIGAVLMAIGLGLYGYTRHTARRKR